MAYILSTASAFPPHYYTQDQLLAALPRVMANPRLDRALLERFHRNVMVNGRHTALPMQAYEELSGFGESNDAWIKVALDLGEELLCRLLEDSGLGPREIALIAFTTVTGITVPSIEARLMNRIPFRENLKRLPLFGLGCLGGAAGLAHVFDYLEGHPYEAAILLSIELCSLTLQKDDVSVENLISSGLFGDGAAAVLMVGDRHPLAEPGMAQVIGSRSILFPNSEYIMGWEVRDSGFKVLLSTDVLKIAESRLRSAIEEFLDDYGLDLEDISCWVAHPGGPKVMEAMERGLGLGQEALALSRESLASVGNISSASVLLVLHENLSRVRPPPGAHGLVTAMGPGFSAAMVLLKW